MAQWTDADYFLLGRFISRLKCRRTQMKISSNLELSKVSSLALGNDFKMTEMSVDVIEVTGHPRVTTPNGDLNLEIIAKRCQLSITSDLSLQQSAASGITFSWRFCKPWNLLVSTLAGLSDVFHSLQIIVTSS
ncbi:hypothetical protein TNCV_3467831 [Trichonephila clavipes]|nr:hypothetical protein TNCV_3467831 [Trichonephila clavipes]